MTTQTEQEGFKFSYTNKERALKELEEQENIKQTELILSGLDIEVIK